jgi:hypothetical protein
MNLNSSILNYIENKMDRNLLSSSSFLRKQESIYEIILDSRFRGNDTLYFHGSCLPAVGRAGQLAMNNLCRI